MKALVAAFNQEKALVGAFSVITNLRMELFEALVHSDTQDTNTTMDLIIIFTSSAIYIFAMMTINATKNVFLLFGHHSLE